MTPQERQLIDELFDRLASLESNPRDPDAEAMIREGLRRAPNAVYALVQTVLVQDEALKAANNRIQELRAAVRRPPARRSSRAASSTPCATAFSAATSSAARCRAVPPGGRAGGPVPTRWGQQAYARQQGYQQPQGYPPGYQAGAPMQPQAGGGGGSFLGTAAAAAAGMIGGSLLMSGIRSAWRPPGWWACIESIRGFGGRGEGGSPGGGNAAAAISRARPVSTISAAGRGGGGSGGAQRTGLLDSNQDRRRRPRTSTIAATMGITTTAGIPITNSPICASSANKKAAAHLRRPFFLVRAGQITTTLVPTFTRP